MKVHQKPHHHPKPPIEIKIPNGRRFPFENYGFVHCSLWCFGVLVGLLCWGLPFLYGNNAESREIQAIKHGIYI